MRKNGKIDYLEMRTTTETAESLKQFYTAAFNWSFTDYGPTYSAYNEGLDGGFDASPAATAAPLPVLYSEDLEATLIAVKQAGGSIIRPIFEFPGGRRFHFTDPSGNELAVWSPLAAK